MSDELDADLVSLAKTQERDKKRQFDLRVKRLGLARHVVNWVFGTAIGLAAVGGGVYGIHAAVVSSNQHSFEKRQTWRAQCNDAGGQVIGVKSAELICVFKSGLTAKYSTS